MNWLSTLEVCAATGLATILALGAAPATAQVLGPEFTSDELKCQNSASTTSAKLLIARTKCLTKCFKGVRAGVVAASDCQPPAFGGATAACIRDAVEGAEAKALATIAKVCAKDCPECYAGGDCPARASQVVATTGAMNDTQLTPFIYCGTQAVLTPGEAKCEDAAAKQATKLASGLAKCGAKCQSAEAAGKVPVGSCSPPAQDLVTAACVEKAQDKSIAAIDKVCGIEKPACYSAIPGLLFTGVVTASLNGQYAATYCGFPSSAFLD